MDWRKATMLSQSLTMLAMVLVSPTRMENAAENVPRIVGVDALLLGAVLVLTASTTTIVYAVRSGEQN